VNRTVDGIEDLQMSSGPYARRGDRATRRFEDVAEESEEVIGLGVESERVQRAQREGGVANPV